MACPKGQLNLEFLLMMLFAVILFSFIFSLYSSQAAEARRAGLMLEAEGGCRMLGSTINALAAAKDAESAEVLLPAGSYSLAIKGKTVRASLTYSPESEYTYPLITGSASLPGNANGGDLLKLSKKGGVIYVSAK